MADIRDTIPLVALSEDAAAVGKRVQASPEPLIVTQDGQAAAVMLNLEVYERGERERRLLRLLLRREQEIAAGIGYDLDDVLAEADALLAEDSP